MVGASKSTRGFGGPPCQLFVPIGRCHAEMAEEHRCQAPRLCVNNCGFFGSPATNGLCSKCHHNLQHQQQQQSSAKLAFDQTLTAAATTSTANPGPSSSSPPPVLSPVHRVDRPVLIDNHKEDVIVQVQTLTLTTTPPPQQCTPNRCLTCRKRVGLTGFKCKCGLTFCGTHRYPEKHACTFNFKALGKEQIARENPIVKADKLVEKI